jgi:hypothetical protein
MNTELLRTVGQIAGIGGIALGVFLILFRELIRKSVFPRLSARQASRLLTLIAVLVWSVALAGIGAWVWTETHGTGDQADMQSMDVQRGVGAGGSIRDSEITISTPAAPPAGDKTPVATGIRVEGGVGAGGDIEGSRIDISTDAELPEQSGDSPGE